MTGHLSLPCLCPPHSSQARSEQVCANERHTHTQTQRRGYLLLIQVAKPNFVIRGMWPPVSPATLRRAIPRTVGLERSQALLDRMILYRALLACLALVSMGNAFVVVLDNDDIVLYANILMVVLSLLGVVCVVQVHILRTLLIVEHHRTGSLRLVPSPAGTRHATLPSEERGAAVASAFEPTPRNAGDVPWASNPLAAPVVTAAPIALRSLIENSPYRLDCACEMLVWLIFVPPYLRELVPNIGALDVVCFLRVYALLSYWDVTQFSSRASCIALSRFSGIPLSTRLAIAVAFEKKPMAAFMTSLWTAWIVLSLLFCRFEGRNFSDSLYFVWVSTGTIGYGDIYPRTTGGKCVTILCGILMWFLLSYGVNGLLKQVNQQGVERNFTTILCASMALANQRTAAVVLIQCAYRFARAKRQPSRWFGSAASVPQQLSSYRLFRAIIAFHARRAVARKFSSDVDELLATFEHVRYLTGGVSSSRVRSPSPLMAQQPSAWQKGDCVDVLEKKVMYLCYLVSRMTPAC